MHYNVGYTGVANACKGAGPGTGFVKGIKCEECKEILRAWHSVFPMAHNDKAEGGRR